MRRAVIFVHMDTFLEFFSRFTKGLPPAEGECFIEKTAEVFLRHGLMCFGCAIARFENLEQGAMAHGIDVEALVQDLNAAVPQPG